MLSVRPLVDKLSFHVFGRALHPELFEFHGSRRVDREQYQLRYQITNVGHVVSVQVGGLLLVELAASSQQLLPKQRLLHTHEIGQRTTAEIILGERIRYRCESQREPADERCFLAFQQAFAQPTECDGLFCQFASPNRIGFGAVSYVNVETRTRSVRVRAFHTFPETQTMIKSNSVFELL